MVGCSPSAPKFGDDDHFLKQFNTGYAGYAWEFQDKQGKSVWQSSISLLLDGYVNPNILNVNHDAFEELRETLDDSKYMVMWFTKNWKEYYFDAKLVQRAMDRGKIPVFLYWYFGDDVATENFRSIVNRKSKDYLIMHQKVIKFMNQLQGDVVLLFEPEFNKKRLVESPSSTAAFIQVMDFSLNYFRTHISPNVHLYMGLSMNDNGIKYKDENFDLCGYEHCALGDLYTWNKGIKILNALADKLDVVAFSMMLSPFSRGFDDPDKAHNYQNEKLGIGYLPQRIANLTHELHTRLDKPVFLSHLVMATGTWNDENGNQKIEANEVDGNGWNKEVYETYANFDYKLFHHNGMFGLALMNLFDDPKHDMGGYNYFLQNEHHLGVVGTGTDPESLKPKDGQLEFKTFNGERLIDLIY